MDTHHIQTVDIQTVADAAGRDSSPAPTRSGKHLGSTILIGGLTLVAACGGSIAGSSADPSDPLVQSIALAMAEDEGDMLLGDPSDSECFARRTVGGLGADRLADLEVTIDNPFDEDDIPGIDFTDAEINTLIDNLDHCIDLEANLARGIANNGNMSLAEAECVAESFGTSTIRDWLAGDFRGDESDEFEARLQDAFERTVSSCDITGDGAGDDAGPDLTTAVAATAPANTSPASTTTTSTTTPATTSTTTPTTTSTTPPTTTSTTPPTTTTVPADPFDDIAEGDCVAKIDGQSTRIVEVPCESPEAQGVVTRTSKSVDIECEVGERRFTRITKDGSDNVTGSWGFCIEPETELRDVFTKIPEDCKDIDTKRFEAQVVLCSDVDLSILYVELGASTSEYFAAIDWGSVPELLGAWNTGDGVRCGEDLAATLGRFNVILSTFDHAPFVVWYLSDQLTSEELLKRVNFTFSGVKMGCN